MFELDVSRPQEELDAKAREIWEIYGKVDVLVNNAGYIDAGLVEEITSVLPPSYTALTVLTDHPASPF